VREDVSPTGSEERTHHVGGTRRHSGEPAGAGTAQQAQEDGLRAVVCVMARRDDGGSDARRFLPERSPSGFPSSSLKIAPVRHLDARVVHRDIQRVRDARGELDLGSGLQAKGVVDPVGDEFVPDRLSKEGQYVEQGHRVASPAHGGEHEVAAPEEPSLAYGTRREGQQRWGVRTAHGSFLLPSSNSLQKATAPPTCSSASRVGLST